MVQLEHSTKKEQEHSDPANKLNADSTSEFHFDALNSAAAAHRRAVHWLIYVGIVPTRLLYPRFRYNSGSMTLTTSGNVPTSAFVRIFKDLSAKDTMTRNTTVSVEVFRLPSSYHLFVQVGAY